MMLLSTCIGPGIQEGGMHFTSFIPDDTGLAEDQDAQVPLLCFSVL